MKEYLKQHNISIYNLSKQTGIPYSTLNDIINRKTDIDNVRFGHIKALSSFLGLSLDQFAGLFNKQDLAVTETER
ncbi:MAG: helix-turn-helix transcriptional regulator, partial [Eubacterium sp.]|nr:helix-turn-helix transcriptional regulator [Eubacterium sp.]